MDNNTKEIRDQLAELEYCETRIKSYMAHAERLRSLAERTTTTFSYAGSHNTFTTDRREEAIAKLVDLETLIQEEVSRLCDLKQAMLIRLAGVHDNTCRTLLELRYLEGKTWPEIADAMFFSHRHVFNIHKKALNALTQSQNDGNIQHDCILVQKERGKL